MAAVQCGITREGRWHHVGDAMQLAEELRGKRGIWRLAERAPAELWQQVRCAPMLAHLLYCRGYRTPEEIESVLAGIPISHDPWLLPDMDAAIHRITSALRSGERIAIYGDFDCDGVTAAAILRETLRGYGHDPLVYLPERVNGHGLNPTALAALRDAGVSLIVTADTGVTAITEVQVARGMGMDVVVTDHHEARPDGSLPACPTVDPTRHDSEYPFSALCGAGIAYKVAQALASSLHGPDPASLLDLVALGTVADVVPLRDENRSLVIQGLQRLRLTARPGLCALFQAAGVDPQRLDPISVSFALAPRINAANRMASPQIAYDLLTTTDPDRAVELAAQLSALNGQRQILVAELMARLITEFGHPERVTEAVLAGERQPLLIYVGDWAAGLSGLLAGKLAELYGLPAFIGTAGEDAIAVSVRSTAAVRIDEVLEACEAALPGGLFDGYGGHARAAGFRVQRDRWETAVHLLTEEVARQSAGAEPGAVLQVDAEVGANQLNLLAAESVQSLAPFGAGFPEPLFLVRSVTLHRLRPLSDGRHARTVLRRDVYCFDGVYFNSDQEFLALQPGARLDLVFNLHVDEWQGRRRPELIVRDWRPAG